MALWLVALAAMLPETVGKADDKYAGTCLHGHLIAEEERTHDDHCGSCEDGYRLRGTHCEAYAGKCKHGRLIAQEDRTQDDHCGSCDHGYYLHHQHCEAYAGSCSHGHLVRQKDRTQDDHCGSCDHGYYLHHKRCQAYDGTCKHGHLVPQQDRTQDNHCGRCNHGYYLQHKHCEAYGGTCKYGHLVAQQDRTQDDHCGSCDRGYYLQHKHCKAYAGSCLHGDLITQKNRTRDNHCGSCDHGYHLRDNHCESYGGACKHGHLIAQEERTRDNHCGSCEAGYGLRDKQCELCPKGTYSYHGVCTGCNFLTRILDQQKWNNAIMDRPSDLEECKDSAIFRLAQTKHFLNRRDFAVVLDKLGASFQAMVQGKTPVSALVQHCHTCQESECRELRQLLWELIRHKADLRSGSPMDVAEDNECHVLYQIIRKHSRPEHYWEGWKYAYSNKTPVFIGPKHMFSISLVCSVAVAFVVGIVAGMLTNCLQLLWQKEPELHADDAERQCMAEPVKPCRGARELAARAHFSFWEERFQYLMCTLVVNASVVFPLHVCMSTITPAAFLPLYFLTLGVPKFFDRSRCYCCDFASLLIPSHGLSHAFAIARPILLYTLSAIVGHSEVVTAMQNRAQLVLGAGKDNGPLAVQTIDFQERSM